MLTNDNAVVAYKLEETTTTMAIFTIFLAGIRRLSSVGGTKKKGETQTETKERDTYTRLHV